MTAAIFFRSSARACAATFSARGRARCLLHALCTQITFATRWKRRLRTMKPRMAAWIMIARSSVTWVQSRFLSAWPRYILWIDTAACTAFACRARVTFRVSTPRLIACSRCAERKRMRARSNSERAMRRRMRLTRVRASQPRMFRWIIAAAISRCQTFSYLPSHSTRPLYPRHTRWISRTAQSSASARMASLHIFSLTRKPRAKRWMVITCFSCAAKEFMRSL
mmetsp:Transcript_100763/g.285624  ORF Transcript_100763/g.285624 Transcript_100763/m.285624 type:complete len:223 (+) Transcript_100763:268-936(+)